MSKMTVHIPDDLLNKLRKEHPHINWAEVARSAVIKKLNKLEELQKRGEL
jgi:hypothetical protein